jgi:hypothetical protein
MTRLSFLGVYRVIKTSHGGQGHLKTIKNTIGFFWRHYWTRSLLREPRTHAPAGCHCTTHCAAPVVQGRQQPCRDLEKASRFASQSHVGYQ